MKVKKYLCLLLCLAMSAGLLAGCASNEDSEETPQEEEQEETEQENEGEEEETDTTSDPVEIFSGALDENGFFAGVTASDIVTLPDYKGISIPEEYTIATAEELQEDVDTIMENYAEYVHVTDRAVEDGDTINMDYVGTIDGEEFDGGSTQGNGTTVTIGVTQYIDDFLEQLIGHTPGENFDIEVTFPETYQNSPDLAGKDAVFNVTINYIQGDLIPRELDDEIAMDYGFETAADLLTALEESIVMNKEAQFAAELFSQATCEEVPQEIITYMENLERYSLDVTATTYGMEPDLYVQTVYGVENVDAYIDGMTEDDEAQATSALAAQAIAELEGLTVTEEDMAMTNLNSYSQFCGEPYVKNSVLYMYVVPQFIVENGTVEQGTEAEG